MWPGSFRPKRFHAHTVIASPAASSSTRIVSGGNNESSGKSEPSNGHRNDTSCRNAPESTSPHIQPIGRQMIWRRTSRDRPIVAEHHHAEHPTASTSEWP